MNWQILLFGLFVALAMLAYFGGLTLVRRRGAVRKLGPLAQRLSLERTDDPEDPTRIALAGEWDGGPLRVIYTTPGYLQSDRVRIALDVPLNLGGQVRFQQRGFWHRLAHRVGLIPAVATVDRDFHRRIAPEATHDEEAERLVGEGAVRETLLRLIRDRRTRVTLDSEGVVIEYRKHALLPGRGLRRHLRPGAATATVTDLEQLADAARMALRGHRPPARAAGTSVDAATDAEIAELATLAEVITGHRGGRILASGPALLIVGPAVLLWGLGFPPVQWTLYGIGLAGGGALAVAFMIFAFRVLRGRTRALRDFVVLSASACVGLLCLVPGALAGVNGVFDSREPTLAPATIERRFGDGPHVQVRLADRPSRLLLIEVPLHRSDDIELDQRIEVWVAPGFLDQAWMVGFARMPEE